MKFDFWRRKPKRKPKVIPPAIKSEKPKSHPKPRPEPYTPPRPTPDAPKREPHKPPSPKPKPDIPKREPRTNVKHHSDPIRDHEKEFLRIFRLLTYMHSPWEVWRDFVTMYACAISNAVDKTHYEEREKLYLSIINKYKKSDQTLFPQLVAETVMSLEINPEQDFLGKLFMILELGNDAKAQIFTPYSVCQLMADITMSDVVTEVNKKGYVTISDPCCGAGATLIAGIHAARKALEKEGLNFQNHVLIVGQDIDATVALMCYIQISLLGMAGYIKIGNSLTEPVADGDSLKTYWYTPVYFMDVWVARRLVNEMMSVFEERR